MSATNWVRRADSTRSLMYWVLGVGFCGALLALSAASALQSIRFKVGAGIVIAVVAISVIVFPISFAFHIIAMVQRRKQLIAQERLELQRHIEELRSPSSQD